jgi:hypothetical protein
MMMFTKVLSLALLISVTQSSASSSTSSERGVASASASPCAGEPTVPNHRRACNFYAWDIRSAALYKWCHHLLKDHVYEGRGGKLFVRFESNSILQLLYPCSRYSPNKCIVCGGSFPDHLELWWSKHLYTPFDMCMDKTYKEGVLMTEDGTQTNKNIGKGTSKKSTPEVVGPPKYAFHRRYVEDVNDLIQGTKGFDNQMNVLKQKLGKESKGKSKSLDQLRLTQFPEYGVAYLTPRAKSENGKRLSWTLRIARSLCLLSLENLVELQENENEGLRNGEKT